MDKRTQLRKHTTGHDYGIHMARMYGCGTTTALRITVGEAAEQPVSERLDPGGRIVPCLQQLRTLSEQRLCTVNLPGAKEGRGKLRNTNGWQQERR